MAVHREQLCENNQQCEHKKQQNRHRGNPTITKKELLSQFSQTTSDVRIQYDHNKRKSIDVTTRSQQ